MAKETGDRSMNKPGSEPLQRARKLVMLVSLNVAAGYAILAIQDGYDGVGNKSRCAERVPSTNVSRSNYIYLGNFEFFTS